MYANDQLRGDSSNKKLSEEPIDEMQLDEPSRESIVEED